MLTFLKKTLRTTFIVSLLVGGAAAAVAVVAGPQRARVIVGQVHNDVLQTIDSHIDDPGALRAQLAEMEKEYPARISQVGGDLAELDQEIRQLKRESAIASRVVELADADLSELGAVLAHAGSDTGQTQLTSAVTFQNTAMSVDRAKSRQSQIRNTRVAYANRRADADYSLQYLNQQRGRLVELKDKLEGERSQFRSQIAALSRQVDAISRNERLISLLEKRNRTIEECSRYEAVSLDQLTNKLTMIRSRQEAELDVLAQSEQRGDYEDVARMQIAEEGLTLEAETQGMTDTALEGYRELLPGQE